MKFRRNLLLLSRLANVSFVGKQMKKKEKVKKKLQHIFKVHEPVVYVEIIRDFAFFHFESSEDAENAMHFFTRFPYR